jgi:hypothetical protein
MKQNSKHLIKLFGGLILTAIIFFSLSSTVFAVADYVQLAPIPGTAKTTGGTDLSTYLTGMFKVAIAAAGVLAFLMIVWGGFTYLSTDAITGKEEGKARIQRALGGLILALASYIILYTINPNLVSLNLNFGPTAELQSSLKPPSDYISATDAEVADMTSNGNTGASQGVIAQKVREQIQDLDNKKNNGTLTATEEVEWNRLNIIREGATTLSAVKRAEVNIKSELAHSGLPSQIADTARTGIAQLRIETETRIASLKAAGATDAQIQVVRDSLEKTVQRIETCIVLRSDLSTKGDEFNTYCK